MFGLKADSENRHRIFIETVLEKGVIWGLRSEDGWAIAPSTEYEEANVMPFWSHRGAAKAAAQDEWSDYEPTEIVLATFIDSWLCNMHEDGLLVGTNWNANLLGMEIEPIDLAQVLDSADD